MNIRIYEHYSVCNGIYTLYTTTLALAHHTYHTSTTVGDMTGPARAL